MKSSTQAMVERVNFEFVKQTESVECASVNFLDRSTTILRCIVIVLDLVDVGLWRTA